MKFSEATWRSVKKLLEAGMKATEIAKRVPRMRPQDIYNKNKKWKREAYYNDPKFAKFHTPQYKALRLACFRRDGFRCRMCHKGGKYVRLEMDHILPWSTHVELRFKLSNVRTLCARCHRSTPTFGKKALNYRHLK